MMQGINSLGCWAGFFVGVLDFYGLISFADPSVSCAHNLENGFIFK